MPAFLNWLLRLLPTNPICMRLVQGGSRRLRHLYIRSAYLGIMTFVLLAVLLPQATAAGSMRNLASGGANAFELVSYLQVGLICLLTPVFMAGAIAQEANPRTWDILLTTPLNSMQVVLGNLFGRLFFIVALLFSTLPLFAMTQYFGGVPGESIFASYAIAAMSSLLVAAIAVTLSVTRTAGRRAVFIFYVSVVMYLFITYAYDLFLRVPAGPGMSAMLTTAMTPLNPFLALEVLLKSNDYQPHEFTGTGASWLARVWLGRPIATFCWLCAILSLVLIAFSTLRLRIIGAAVGSVPWYRKLAGLGAKGAQERPARSVGANPIAWRERTARNRTLAAIFGRWFFVAIGIGIGVTLVVMFHVGSLTAGSLRLAVSSVIAAEIVIICLVALNMSATAVSREREDGTLDIILTTPIQPGPYLRGKHLGLTQYLLPMIIVPAVTMLIVAIYGMARGGAFQVAATIGSTNTPITVPVVLPEAALALPLVLAPFVAFCVTVGLNWSIKSKGTIGSVIGAVGMVLVIAGILSLCAFAAANSLSLAGASTSMLSPITMVWALVFPEDTISGALSGGATARAIALVAGAVVAGLGYGVIVYFLHTNMKRTFMMTVRKLAGSN